MRTAPFIVLLPWMLALASCEGPTVRVGSSVLDTAVDASLFVAAAVEDISAPSFSDRDFIESEANRDPFRRYVVADPPPPDLPVRLADTDVAQMRLIGIVSSRTSAHVLVLDRGGEGHVLQRGEYLGRVQTVRMSGLTIVVRWRVVRIRDGSVVLERHDPRFPERAPDTHVLALRVDT